MHHDHKIEYSKKNYYFYFMDDCNRLFRLFAIFSGWVGV